MVENGLGNTGSGGNCWSGVPNGLGSRGIRHFWQRNGLEMVRNALAYLDLCCSTDGLVSS